MVLIEMPRWRLPVKVPPSGIGKGCHHKCNPAFMPGSAGLCVRRDLAMWSCRAVRRGNQRSPHRSDLQIAPSTHRECSASRLVLPAACPDWRASRLLPDGEHSFKLAGRRQIPRQVFLAWRAKATIRAAGICLGRQMLKFIRPPAQPWASPRTSTHACPTGDSHRMSYNESPLEE